MTMHRLAWQPMPRSAPHDCRAEHAIADPDSGWPSLGLPVQRRTVPGEPRRSSSLVMR